MKYYGMTFNKFKSTKRMVDNQLFDDVYEALESANKQWNAENEDDFLCMRLLIILHLNEKSEITECAFFQFKDFKSCQNFVNAKEKIRWSIEGKEVWQGNIHIMGKSVQS